jgi:outer membrane protein assembly factor BamB
MKAILVWMFIALLTFRPPPAFDQMSVLNKHWDVPITDAGKAPQARPLMTKEAIYLAASNIEAFSIADGRPLWKQPVHHTIPNGLVEHGTLICAADEKAYCLAKESGAALWVSDLVGDGSLSTPVLDGDRLIVGTNRHYVFAFSVSDGRLLWRKDVMPTAIFPSIVTGEAVSGKFIYISSTQYLDQSGSKTRGAVQCLDSATGSLVWSKTVPGEADRTGATDVLVTSGGRLIVVDRIGNRIMCLSLLTHKLLWQFKGDEGFVGIADAPVVDKTSLYLGSGDRTVYSLHIMNGEVVWKQKLRGSVNSLVKCGDYLIASDGELSAFMYGSGSVLYTDVEMNPTSRITSKLFSSNQNLVFASRNSLSYYTCDTNQSSSTHER